MTPFPLAGLLLAAALITGCGERQPGSATAPAGGAPKAPPPPQVGVIAVRPEPVVLSTELPGRLEALRVAQVRARVAGIVQKRHFAEGSDVKAGQVLFTLDAAPFRAALASARAALARAEANLGQARMQVGRLEPLARANAVSQQEFTNAQSAQKLAEAERAATRAALDSAQINLDYATIKAPIAGRIGRSLVSEGALVGQGEATPLAVIQQIDPVYVNFTQSATELLALRRALAQGRLRGLGEDAGARVNVLLDDGSAWPHAGRLLFSDLTVDQGSGQVTLRAQVPNPGQLLLPGMYVRVRVEQARLDAAILVPQQAVSRSASGDSLFVVDEKDVARPRPMQLHSAQGGRWLVSDGLKAGERVVVDGFQRMRPGAPVRPVPWQPPGTARAAPAPRQ